MSFEPHYINTWIMYALFAYMYTLCLYHIFLAILNTMDSYSHYPKKNTFIRKFDYQKNTN